ncbi:MAG: hypothetical protein VX229_07485 [Pseudomonadota bacterium]|nr:hypothetical protein [Pseudomonadota bacterium]
MKTNVTPTDRSLERMIEIIVQELKPAVSAMVDERLKEAGVGAAGGEGMAANLAKYTLPGSEFEAPDGDAPSRASNGRKMPPSLADLYQAPDADDDDRYNTLPS